MSHHIYLLSDATGGTVEMVVSAALSQFRGVDYRLHRFTRLRTSDDIIHALEVAAKEPGVLIYTLVNQEHGRLLREQAESRGIAAVDLISPLIYKLADFFGTMPQEVPGLLYKLDSEYYKRMDAVNFAVKQDDGQEPGNLHKADMILVGVSRTSKTPLSMYLANRGYKVANIPLVNGVDPPGELFEVDQKRVVGLLIENRRLVELRSARLRNLRQNPHGDYADFDMVEEELEFCRRLYRRHPEWLIIDVTNKSVEESAAEILKKLNYIEAG
ncbi:MAG TPA: pyruvate, water dikinase regulatory protein [Geobacteraceae bacterium]|nr:pyruvate, water dikinase regulatory protein [Geobacteraceae bacterium]